MARKVLTIIGSLRDGSTNKMLGNEAKLLAPKNLELEIFIPKGIPEYNQDVEDNLPNIVQEMKDKIKSADAILFVTPEYNNSIPGVLKNAIDWGSRPPMQSAWSDKPVAIMGVSTGMGGDSVASSLGPCAG